jgi:hypothetical protein
MKSPAGRDQAAEIDMKVNANGARPGVTVVAEFLDGHGHLLFTRYGALASLM